MRRARLVGGVPMTRPAATTAHGPGARQGAQRATQSGVGKPCSLSLPDALGPLSLGVTSLLWMMTRAREPAPAPLAAFTGERQSSPTTNGEARPGHRAVAGCPRQRCGGRGHGPCCWCAQLSPWDAPAPAPAGRGKASRVTAQSWTSRGAGRAGPRRPGGHAESPGLSMLPLRGRLWPRPRPAVPTLLVAAQQPGLPAVLHPLGATGDGPLHSDWLQPRRPPQSDPRMMAFADGPGGRDPLRAWSNRWGQAEQ